MKKNIIKLTGVALLAAASIGIGSTMAALQHHFSIRNEIQTPTVTVQVKEELGEPDNEGVKPKKVTFKNTGTAPVFLRVAYAENWTEQGEDQGEKRLLPNKNGASSPIVSKQESFAESEWVNGGDGWYYYKKILFPQKETGSALTSVDFSSIQEKDPSYAGKNYQLYFQTEVVQASDEWEVSHDAVSELFAKSFTAEDLTGQVINESNWSESMENATLNWTAEGGN